ncbi:MAG: hypothetical protein COA79_22520 [Planctomycetota bacterium]|nr:MAG: hypothetical protein COA79_22520 [Planctomycetota bacterium]
MKYKFLILFCFLIFLSGCGGNSNPSGTIQQRYSIDTMTGMGGLAVVYNITDHKLNKMYIYKVGDNLELEGVVDLSKVGEKIIDIEMSSKVKKINNKRKGEKSPDKKK